MRRTSSRIAWTAAFSWTLRFGILLILVLHVPTSCSSGYMHFNRGWRSGSRTSRCHLAVTAYVSSPSPPSAGAESTMPRVSTVDVSRQTCFA